MYGEDCEMVVYCPELVLEQIFYGIFPSLQNENSCLVLINYSLLRKGFMKEENEMGSKKLKSKQIGARQRDLKRNR
jgi:hypothetical protein